MAQSDKVLPRSEIDVYRSILSYDHAYLLCYCDIGFLILSMSNGDVQSEAFVCLHWKCENGSQARTY